MFGLIPMTILGLAGASFFANSKRPEKGLMTPQRQMIFETAINEVKDVDKLRALSKAFKEQGLNSHAALLEKRANLRELPPEVKAARKATFKKAMASDNPQAIRTVADAFESQGANGAANALREYANSLITKELEKRNKEPEINKSEPEIIHPEVIPSTEETQDEAK